MPARFSSALRNRLALLPHSLSRSVSPIVGAPRVISAEYGRFLLTLQSHKATVYVRVLTHPADGSALPPHLSRTDALASVRRAYERRGSRTGVHPASLGRQRRERLLPALRLHDRLFLPAPERRAALALQSLPQGFFGYERHAVRVPQAAATLLPSRHCNLLQ